VQLIEPVKPSKLLIQSSEYKSQNLKGVNIFYTSMKKIHGNFALFLSIQNLGMAHATYIQNDISIKFK
jgi:hypothetical protein